MDDRKPPLQPTDSIFTRQFEKRIADERARLEQERQQRQSVQKAVNDFAKSVSKHASSVTSFLGIGKKR